MDTKNDIKKRMMVTAAKSWGVSVKELERADPIVSLLIDACSSELGKVSSTIEDTRETMGNKLMELVTPESLLSPYPARAIIHAYPFDNKFKLTSEHHFYITKENPFDKEELPVDIYFTPVASQMLVSGEVEYMAVNKTLFRLGAALDKKTICRSKDNDKLPSGQLWLGLKMNKQVDLDEVSFYFDLEQADEHEQDVFYCALASSRWSVNDREVSIKVGFEVQNNKNNLNKINLPLSEFNKAFNVFKHIRKFYETRFVTIQDKQGITGGVNLENPYPLVFEEVFDAETLEEEIEGKILWIKVDFTEHIPYEIFNKISCSVNCIPVLNLKQDHVIVNGKERIRELYAEEHEQFLDLKEINCEDNLEIIFEHQKNDDLAGKALLMLRHDNIGRFNKRNALETIRYLRDVYYEEYAAFSKIEGIEHEHIEELGKAIRPFEIILEDVNRSAAKSMPYLMLKTEEENDEIDVDVSYWLTNGAFANGIQSQETLKFDSAELIRNKIFLITETIGGKDQKRNEDLINEFKYSLLTNDKIVTLEDVKALCRMHFGELADTVDVSRSVEMDAKTGSGLHRIIDITIRLKKNVKLPDWEMMFLKKDVEVKLQEKSLNAMPYRVNIIR